MMKYEIKVFSSRKILDIVLGTFIIVFIVWATASCSPLLTAIIVTFITVRALVETDHLQLRNDILHLATSGIDHKYGLKGANFEQSVKVIIDVEEMKRNGFEEKTDDVESEPDLDNK